MKRYLRIVYILLTLCALVIYLSACKAEGLAPDPQDIVEENKDLPPDSQDTFEKRAYEYFCEVSKIPRGSGKEQAISDYLVAFAKENGLEVYQDSYKNVLITKPGSAGREEEPPVILQAHMDMVCTKNRGVKHDFLKDAIIPSIGDDWVKSSEETTLGADDGAGMAMILAVLTADNLSHPPIEAMITVSEEESMRGATYFDYSQFEGKRFINVDSEEEGVLTVSSAGYAYFNTGIFAEYEAAPQGLTTYQLTVKGLAGGHSGLDINKGRANAIVLMAAILNAFDDGTIYLTSLLGGPEYNVIPKECMAIISFAANDLNKIQSVLAQMEAEFKAKYPFDNNLAITLGKMEEDIIFEHPVGAIIVEKTDAAERVMSHELMQKFLNWILSTPNGVQAMSSDFPGLVQTSNNLCYAGTRYDFNGNDGMVFIVLYNCMRSSKTEDLTLLLEKMEAKAKELGADYIEGELGEAPWQYKEDSPLRDTMAAVYEEVYGEAPKISGLHGGLECAIFAKKMPDADLISIGPTIENAHTPDERMSLSSFNRICNYLIKVLEAL